MKHISALVLGALALLPASVSAAALYDGSGLYVQAVLDADIGIDLSADATTTGDTATGTSRTTASTSAGIGTGGVQAAIDVATEADLAAYGESLEANDSNVDRAEADVDGDVIVSYYHPARLFGIFPVRAKSVTTVAVASNGMVESETRMPWWSMFATGTGDIASSIDTDIANSGEVSADMKLAGNAAARARVLEAVANAHARAMVRAAGS